MNMLWRLGMVGLMAAGVAQAQELQKLSLDDAAGLGLKIEADKAVKAEGGGSVKITTLWPTTVCLGEVVAPAVRGGALVYRARVRTNLKGSAYLELWCNVAGGSFFAKGMNAAVEGQSDWKTIGTTFLLKSGQKPSKVTLNLVIEGSGTVWVDDVVLSRESAP
jgi:hypothetical protein